MCLVLGTRTRKPPPAKSGSYAWLSVTAVTCHLSSCERGEAPIILLRGFFFGELAISDGGQ
jgi:hypothetical protein